MINMNGLDRNMDGKNQNKKRFILKDQMIHMELNGNNKVLVLLFIGGFHGIP